MQNAFVVAEEGTDRRRVSVGAVLVVGRGKGCGLTVRDPAASRRHLEIVRNDGSWECRDLDSRNGTTVNGRPVRSCRLEHGDEIAIGATRLRFELDETPPISEAAGDRTMFHQTVIDASGRHHAPRTSRSRELLEAAYALMNSLATSFDQCQLVDRILETTMNAVHAQRGAVFFAGADHRLRPCPECGQVHTIRDGVPRPAGLDDITISESVARRVLSGGENVLYQSARSDGDDVDRSVSIANLKLTSILCVPIRTQERVLGVLYIDTDLTDHEYSEDDLLLASAAGNSAGLALENVRAHTELLSKQRMEQDIEAAWTIQESFLVNDWPTDDPRFEVYGVTRPARVVGGDFYDFARLDGDLVGMLIGDVSGKGVPAALTMALLLAEFRLCAAGAESTAEVLRRLNERMVGRSRRGTFCTAALVAVNLDTGTIMGANAGHHPILRIAGDRVSTFLPASGPPLGILAGADWQDESSVVVPGETLLLYTDGIVEARAGGAGAATESAHREYGVEGMTRAILAAADRTPRGLIGAVLADVEGFCGPASPHDDCTMIALKVNGDG